MVVKIRLLLLRSLLASRRDVRHLWLRSLLARLEDVRHVVMALHALLVQAERPIESDHLARPLV